jgi:hypothetical protein
MSDTLYAVLMAAGGATVVCCAVFASLWKLGMDSLLERFKRSQAEELERLKAYLGVDMARASRFETAQFGAFQEIWNTLADLRIAANRLWEHSSQENLDEFGHHLETARRVIYSTQLVIDRSILNDLRGTIHAFEDFYGGKEGLVQLRQRHQHDIKAIARRIDQNAHLRSRFIEAVDALRASLHEQMRGPDAFARPDGV